MVLIYFINNFNKNNVGTYICMIKYSYRYRILPTFFFYSVVLQMYELHIQTQCILIGTYVGTLKNIQ